MATKNATGLLEGFVVLGIASAATRRPKRRLYGVKRRGGPWPAAGPACRPRHRSPLRPPERRGPGAGPVPLLSPALPALERREFEFGELDKWLDLADPAMPRTQRALELHAAALGRSGGPSDPYGTLDQ